MDSPFQCDVFNVGRRPGFAGPLRGVPAPQSSFQAPTNRAPKARPERERSEARESYVPIELRNSSMSKAGSVRIFVDPRDASATETRAIVPSSGASTTLTKSYSPSVAHWWSTLHPSSATSWLTCRRRSGFDFSVCTPCAVRLERRMYVAIGPPPRSGARLYSRGLVDVQHRRTEDEDRGEHDQRQHGSDP